jgi:hypothetical protein
MKLHLLTRALELTVKCALLSYCVVVGTQRYVRTRVVAASLPRDHRGDMSGMCEKPSSLNETVVFNASYAASIITHSATSYDRYCFRVEEADES